MNDYLPSVTQAVAGRDKTVFVYFSDGAITQFDMKGIIAAGGVFSKLADEDFFTSALTVLNDTVAWDVSGTYDPTTCIDIDPCTVYAAPRVSDPLETNGVSDVGAICWAPA
ncbi:MAG: DUF2442 domain-containing protein [Eggerthellaceae bacterium]|nr:DUF2442 domain-containing protein [Eggerthellaceae bacterium]